MLDSEKQTRYQNNIRGSPSEECLNNTTENLQESESRAKMFLLGSGSQSELSWRWGAFSSSERFACGQL